MWGGSLLASLLQLIMDLYRSTCGIMVKQVFIARSIPQQTRLAIVPPSLSHHTGILTRSELFVTLPDGRVGMNCCLGTPGAFRKWSIKEQGIKYCHHVKPIYNIETQICVSIVRAMYTAHR
jgi:hypothetical protein